VESLPSKAFLRALLVCLVLACSPSSLIAQTDDFGDNAADPIRLFERGQAAHSRGELERALEYYEQALKVRPDFPEAEFQRGNALVALSRFSEAEPAYRKAIELKKGWSLPYSALAALMVRRQRDTEAEPLFRQALAIDPKDNIALRMLSELRLRAGDKKEGLELARRAASDSEAPASARVVLAIAERANGDNQAAKTSLDAVLNDDPNNLAALMERADLLTDEKKFDDAIKDLKSAQKLRPDDKVILARLAYVYQEAGQLNEAQAVAKAAGLEVQSQSGDGIRVIGTKEEIEAANSSDPAVSKKAIERLLEKNPRNAMLMAQLGASYRTEDPARSLEYYRRAAEIDPKSIEYAVGYAAALVQAKRFAAAAHILRQVVKLNPDNYVAHANLATALYEQKDYQSAISEFEWIAKAKPELAVVHYFIATSHDYLREYEDALASYETFMAKADPSTNQLEIDKVKLRLPPLRRQIQLKEGVKRKP
jgi:tetratricopeptide (TPR) repeat protein